MGWWLGYKEEPWVLTKPLCCVLIGGFVIEPPIWASIIWNKYGCRSELLPCVNVVWEQFLEGFMPDLEYI